MGAIRIGISGWTYAPWRGVFFPKKLAQRKELAYAASQVSSIEINGTFYSLQRPESYASWYEQTPPDFLFSVKAPRYITHLRRLKDCATPMANFFASGVLRLEEKLGPLLWQLPPSLPFDAERLETFFGLLPRDTADAVKIAQRHDKKVKRVWTKTVPNRPLRHALEVRHPSFVTPEFVRLLRRHRVSLVVADTAGKWPYMEDVTADFVYARLHGDEELYVSGYTPRALLSWSKKIRAWSEGRDAPKARLTGPAVATRARGRDVFVYFDNDVKTRAPYDAMSLAHRLGMGNKPSDAPPDESISEVPRQSWPALSRENRPRRSVP
jgi:uncharacterized protein YecE (DUF72 family)